MIHSFSHTRQDPKPVLDSRTDIEKQYSLLQVHDDGSANHNMIQSLVNEIGWISGRDSKIYLRTDNNDIDKVRDADHDPTYWPGIQCKMFFEPLPPEQELKKWSLQVDLKQEVYFVLEEINNKCKRLLRAGDVLYSPDLDPVNDIKYYEIISASPSGMANYKYYYLKCKCVNLNNDITVVPPNG